MDDPTVVQKILTHLPNRFEHFVRQVQSERTLPTLDELFSRLHLEESNLKLRHGNNHEEALVMRIRNVIMNRGRGGPPRFTRGETSREHLSVTVAENQDILQECVEHQLHFQATL